MYVTTNTLHHTNKVKHIPSLRCTGQARACLRGWIAAASVVQRCFRLWHLRQGIARGGLIRQRLQRTAVCLQAAWRARPAFRAYRRLRHAVLTTQVCFLSCPEFALTLLRVAWTFVFTHFLVLRLAFRACYQKLLP